MAVVLKTTVPERVPGVRIPLPPPSFARCGELRMASRARSHPGRIPASRGASGSPKQLKKISLSFATARQADALYRKLQARAKRDRRSVAQEVTHILSEALDVPKSLSILELQGLGQELWRGIDATEHVHRERSSWD